MCLWIVDVGIQKSLMSTLTTGCHPKLTIAVYLVFRDLLLATLVPNLLTLCLFSSVSLFMSFPVSSELFSYLSSAAAPFLINGRDRLVATPGISCYSTATGFFALNRINCAFVASLLKHIHRKNNMKVAEVAT